MITNIFDFVSICFLCFWLAVIDKVISKYFKSICEWIQESNTEKHRLKFSKFTPLNNVLTANMLYLHIMHEFFIYAHVEIKNKFNPSLNQIVFLEEMQYNVKLKVIHVTLNVHISSPKMLINKMWNSFIAHCAEVDFTTIYSHFRNIVTI
jgi:hypothetical protein